MNADVETNDEMIARLTRERKVSFWGADYQVTPVLLSETFGDGRQVVKIQPLNTRPDYYLVRVGSDVDIDSEAWCDALEPVIDAIENEFSTGCDDDPFPNPSFSSGYMWAAVAMLN